MNLGKSRAVGYCLLEEQRSHEGPPLGGHQAETGNSAPRLLWLAGGQLMSTCFVTTVLEQHGTPGNSCCIRQRQALASNSSNQVVDARCQVIQSLDESRRKKFQRDLGSR